MFMQNFARFRPLDNVWLRSLHIYIYATSPTRPKRKYGKTLREGAGGGSECGSGASARRNMAFAR